MTKLRKRVQAHVETKWQATSTICDSCQRDVDKVGGGWEMNDIEIEAKIGEVYPEADCREGFRIDLCRECFTDKLVPAVEALGITWTKYATDEMSLYSDCTGYYKNE